MDRIYQQSVRKQCWCHVKDVYEINMHASPQPVLSCNNTLHHKINSENVRTCSTLTSFFLTTQKNTIAHHKKSGFSLLPNQDEFNCLVNSSLNTVNSNTNLEPVFSPSLVSSYVHSHTRLPNPVNLGHVACGDSPCDPRSRFRQTVGPLTPLLTEPWANWLATAKHSCKASVISFSGIKCPLCFWSSLRLLAIFYRLHL